MAFLSIEKRRGPRGCHGLGALSYFSPSTAPTLVGPAISSETFSKLVAESSLIPTVPQQSPTVVAPDPVATYVDRPAKTTQDTTVSDPTGYFSAAGDTIPSNLVGTQTGAEAQAAAESSSDVVVVKNDVPTQETAAERETRLLKRRLRRQRLAAEAAAAEAAIALAEAKAAALVGSTIPLTEPDLNLEPISKLPSFTWKCALAGVGGAALAAFLVSKL